MNDVHGIVCTAQCMGEVKCAVRATKHSTAQTLPHISMQCRVHEMTRHNACVYIVTSLQKHIHIHILRVRYV